MIQRQFCLIPDILKKRSVHLFLSFWWVRTIEFFFKDKSPQKSYWRIIDYSLLIILVLWSLQLRLQSARYCSIAIQTTGYSSRTLHLYWTNFDHISQQIYAMKNRSFYRVIKWRHYTSKCNDACNGWQGRCIIFVQIYQIKAEGNSMK